MAILIHNDNPASPVTFPTADALYNAYQAQAANIRGQAQQEAPQVQQVTSPYANPAKSDSDEAQEEHQSRLQRVLSPIAINKFDADAEYTDEHHRKFAKQLENDPAFKEIADDVHNVTMQAIAARDNGQITNDDAMRYLSQFGAEAVDPILDKHHGKHSDSHKQLLHDDELEEIPNVVKKARGVK